VEKGAGKIYHPTDFPAQQQQQQQQQHLFKHDKNYSGADVVVYLRS